MKQPPKIPTPLLLRRMIPMAFNPIKGFQKYLNEYGETFMLDAGGSRRSIFTTNPDLIQYVLQKNHKNYEKSEIQTDQLGKYIGYGLLTNSGSHWLRQRRLIQPGFHRKRMESLTVEMQRTIEQHCTDLNANITSGEPIEIQKFTLQLTFRIIARAIFTDGFSYDQMEELDDAMTDIQSFIIYPIRLPFLRPVVKTLGYEKKYVDLSEAIGNQMLERVNERRNGGEPKDDLLQMLIDSRYEDDGQPMEDKQMIDEIMILFAAGHETSANALAWTIYLLDQYPDVKKKVRQEINEQLGTDEAPTMEKLRNLPYLTAMLEESMRLYPPAWISDRVALEDDEFEGVKIPKGMVVVPYFYGLHRSEDLYDDPEAFKPERMLAEEKKKRHSYSFLPFGGGPRMCVGFHFAMLEMQLAMIYLLRNYEFTFMGDVKPTPKPYLTLRPDRKIMMRVNSLVTK